MSEQERTIENLSIERGNLVSLYSAQKEKQEEQEFQLTAMQATSNAIKETITAFERRVTEGMKQLHPF